VYVLDLAGGAVTRVTYDDAPETLDGWSADGRWLYLSTAARDVAGMQDVLRVPATGGTPMPVAADRYASEYWAAPSPDGATVAVTARGLVSGQWWRHGRSHIDESEVWTVRPGAGPNGTPAYTQVTAGGAKSAWPMWAAGGRTLYFMSDRGGPENLWAQAVDEAGRPAGAARRLTNFADGRVLWPSAGRDGRTIVFERDFGIWRLDAATGQAAPVPVALRGAPSGVAAERLSLTSFQELAVSPDGRKLALTARGAVFAAVARDATAPGGPAAGGDAVRVTPAAAAGAGGPGAGAGVPTAGPHEGLAWSPDSRRVAYAAQRDGRWRIASYDFVARRETLLTTGGGAAATGGDLMPRWAPDGRALAFVRDGRELRVVDVDAAGAPAGGAGARERLLATAAFERPPFADPRDVAWSPDGRWLAFVAPGGAQQFANVQVVPAAGGAAARPVSAVPNANSGEVSWAPDGSALYFVTGQRTEPGQVARVDLVPRAPRFREDQFQGLFGPGTPPGTPQPGTRRPPRPTRRATPPRAPPARPGGSAPTRCSPAPRATRRRPARTRRAARRAGAHRLRRHPPAPRLPAARARRAVGEREPRRAHAAARRAGGGADQPVDLLARRARARGAGGPPAHVDEHAQERRAVGARLEGGLLPRRRPPRGRGARHAGRAPGARAGGARRRLRAREAGGVRAGVDVPARPLLRRALPRRGLGRRPRPHRAARGRRPHARRAAARAAAHDRRAERVAPGRLGAARGRAVHRPARRAPRPAAYERDGAVRVREVIR
jgi:Tol biopolymer transport system component